MSQGDAESPQADTGWLAPLRRAIAQLLALLQTRLALLGTELEQSAQQLYTGLLWMGAALLMLGLCLTLLVVCAVLSLWHLWGPLALLPPAAVLALGAVWAWRRAQKPLQQAGGLFTLTRAELGADLAALGEASPHQPPQP